jgi:hypothetical protein
MVLMHNVSSGVCAGWDGASVSGAVKSHFLLTIQILFCLVYDRPEQPGEQEASPLAKKPHYRLSALPPGVTAKSVAGWRYKQSAPASETGGCL